MVKRKALLEPLSSNLHDFLKEINQHLSVADKKFLRDGLIGLLRCGNPVVCQMARLVGTRHLLGMSGASESRPIEQGMPIRAEQLAEQIPTPHRFAKLIKRHGRPAIRLTQIGWVKVRLPGRPESLTLVVSRRAGQDKPMMLLTNLRGEDSKDAKRVVRVFFDAGSVKRPFDSSRARSTSRRSERFVGLRFAV
jgi:hypothetical protein